MLTSESPKSTPSVRTIEPPTKKVRVADQNQSKMGREGNSAILKPCPVPLPQELVRAIIDEIEDQNTFLQCRLVSRLCCDASTSSAFQNLIISRKPRSRSGFQNLASLPQLATHVREITLKQEDMTSPDDVTIEGFASSVPYIANFPNINALRLYFPSSLNQGSDKDMTWLFKSLANLWESAPGIKLQRLEIHNYNNTLRTRTIENGLRALLQPITHLFISSLTDNLERASPDINYMFNFDHLLDATDNLTSLTLISDVIRFRNWESTDTLPYLKHLTLHNFVFNHNEECENDTPEPFIVRHADTLRHLDLSGCWLDTGILGYGITWWPSWADIFKNFEDNLKLWSFKFEPLPRSPLFNGYVAFNNDTSRYSADEDKGSYSEGCKEAREDMEAFEDLQKAISQNVEDTEYVDKGGESSDEDKEPSEVDEEIEGWLV